MNLYFENLTTNLVSCEILKRLKCYKEIIIYGTGDSNGVPVLTEMLNEVLSLNKKVVFIKLDIEGAERKAIEGGRELIKKYHPTLAICAYHLRDELLVLQRRIKEIYAGYKLYLRHYLVGAEDTVLYAVS